MSRSARVLVVAASAVTGQAHADWNFREEFNAGFDHTWSPAFSGPPTGAFESLDGAGVYRMTSLLGAGQEVGLATSPVLLGDLGAIEVRFNTVVQDATRIDGLLEFGFFRPDGSRPYAIHLFSGGFSTGRKVLARGRGEFAEQFIDYANNTWYRFRWESGPDLLRASFLTDDGQVLFSQSFTRRLSPDEQYRVYLKQFMGPPGFTADSAVDWIRTIPAPGTLPVLALGLLAARRKR